MMATSAQTVALYLGGGLLKGMPLFAPATAMSLSAAIATVCKRNAPITLPGSLAAAAVRSCCLALVVNGGGLFCCIAMGFNSPETFVRQ